MAIAEPSSHPPNSLMLGPAFKLFCEGNHMA
jgi:hypothetical protein